MGKHTISRTLFTNFALCLNCHSRFHNIEVVNILNCFVSNIMHFLTAHGMIILQYMFAIRRENIAFGCAKNGNL